MSFHADYTNFEASTKQSALEELLLSYNALAESQTNWVANLANCSSLLWYCYQEAVHTNINWSGFYVVDKSQPDQLVLGPFMGKVACQTIQIGRGVCGAAAETKKTQLVPNVNKFPGHIACDGASKSEIVVPIVVEGKLQGVLDIDCVDLNGFDETDVNLLEQLCKSISETCKFN